MDNEKIEEVSGKLKKKAEIPSKNLMICECENMVKSLDRLSTNSICHPQLNFQCWLIQSDLKLETGITYSKFRKAGYNSQKSRG